jgi:hypothetical protein
MIFPIDPKPGQDQGPGPVLFCAIEHGASLQRRPGYMHSHRSNTITDAIRLP